jgi:hypothetical protein
LKHQGAGGIKDVVRDSRDENSKNLYRPFLESLYKDEEIESNEMDV